MPAPPPPDTAEGSAGLAGDEPSTHDQIFLHLDERGYVPFHPTLADQFGHKAAVFVGMALYWTRHSLKNQPQRGGWFYMSIQQWQQSIGLTRSEQTSVRDTLMEAGVLEEMLLGRPAVMNYRLNVAALAKVLSLHRPGRSNPSWETVSGWFRGYQNYYKPLADIAGSIGAGLYLALLLQRHRLGLLRGQLNNGCISVNQDEISESLKLGTKVQRNARMRLKRAGLIQEAGTGGALVRINLDAVLMCLRGQAIRPLKGLERSTTTTSPVAPRLAPMPKVEAPGGSAAAPSVGVDLSGLSMAFRQSSLRLSSTPATEDSTTACRPRDLLLSMLAEDSARPVEIPQVVASASQPAPAAFDSKKPKSDRDLLRDLMGSMADDSPPERNAVSCKLEPQSDAETCKQELPFPATYIQDVFITTTTTDAGSSSGFEITQHAPVDPNGLILPAKLSVSHVPAVLQLLTRVRVEDRQAVLDELEGRFRCLVPVKSPVGWLHGLLQRMTEGPVVFAFAEQVATERRKRDELQAREARGPRPVPAAPTPASEPSPANSDVKKVNRARIADLTAQMRADASAWRRK